MPRSHPPYAPEYRRRIIELARPGRDAQRRRYPHLGPHGTICILVKQASADSCSSFGIVAR